MYGEIAYYDIIYIRRYTRVRIELLGKGRFSFVLVYHPRSTIIAIMAVLLFRIVCVGGQLQTYQTPDTVWYIQCNATGELSRLCSYSSVVLIHELWNWIDETKTKWIRWSTTKNTKCQRFEFECTLLISSYSTSYFLCVNVFIQTLPQDENAWKKTHEKSSPSLQADLRRFRANHIALSNVTIERPVCFQLLCRARLLQEVFGQSNNRKELLRV